MSVLSPYFRRGSLGILGFLIKVPHTVYVTVYPPPPQSRPKLAFDLKPPTKSIAFLSLPFSFSELLKFNVTQEKVRLQSFSFFDNQRNFFEAFFFKGQVGKTTKGKIQWSYLRFCYLPT